MAIDIRLKEVMKEKGVSGRKLAELLDSTPQYVSNICNGRQNMSLDMLNRIANLLGVELWELFVSKGEVCKNGDFLAMVRREGQVYCFESEDDLMKNLKLWQTDYEIRKD